MAYLDQYTLSQNTTFQGRVQVAMLKAASAVLDQVKPESGQLAAARRIVDAPAASAVSLTALVVLDAAVAASAPTGGTLTDAQLQAAVNTYLIQLVR